MAQRKVLVAMSGGVDSSMTASLLKDQGYELVGVTLRVFRSDKYRIDTLTQNIKEASILAHNLQIPYYVVDVSKEFEQIVVNNFRSEYQSGRTPNPCALCNREIKWKYLIEIADNFGCDLIATGHYSRINELNGRSYITKASDEIKDQSFFLWRLNQQELKRTIFPLGQLRKSDIKRLAAEKGYFNLASKRESYNICFIPEGDYRKYLKMNTNSESYFENGNFMNESGKIIGTHQGIANYTVGQRNGINISEQGEWYVLKISAGENLIVLGNQDSLLQKELILKESNFSKYEHIPDNIIIHAKLNYKSNATRCNIIKVKEQLKVRFHEPVSAVSPGQSITFFEGNDLIGGGVID